MIKDEECEGALNPHDRVSFEDLTQIAKKVREGTGQ